ncbi:MAG: hypothetical protein P8175_10495 [Deltaproteobacteria bacterium]
MAKNKGHLLSRMSVDVLEFEAGSRCFSFDVFSFPTIPVFLQSCKGNPEDRLKDHETGSTGRFSSVFPEERQKEWKKVQPLSSDTTVRVKRNMKQVTLNKRALSQF